MAVEEVVAVTSTSLEEAAALSDNGLIVGLFLCSLLAITLALAAMSFLTPGGIYMPTAQPALHRIPSLADDIEDLDLEDKDGEFQDRVSQGLQRLVALQRRMDASSRAAVHVEDLTHIAQGFLALYHEANKSIAAPGSIDRVLELYENAASITDMSRVDAAYFESLFLNHSSTEHHHTAVESPHGNGVPMQNGVANSVLVTSKQRIINEIMKELCEWDFDIFRLEQESYSALYTVTNACLEHLGLVQALKLNPFKFNSFILQVSNGYHKNPYHNATHAADVAQAVMYFLTTGQLHDKFANPEMSLALLLAAAVHDVGHPGVPNSYLIGVHHELALLYNDRSPLENMHVSFAFHLLKNENHRFITDQAVLNRMRPLLIKAVLGTDNAMHMEHLNQLKQHMEAVDKGDKKLLDPEDSTAVTLFATIVLHAADISNPTKPMWIYKDWLERVTEEFLEVADAEEAAGLKFSLLNRSKPVPRSKFQLGLSTFSSSLSIWR